MQAQLPIIDWTQHTQVDSGSADLARELLSLFLQELPELESRAQQAQCANDEKELHAILHRLQGACAYCGLPRLRECIATATNTLKQQHQLSAAEFAILELEIAAVKTALAEQNIVAPALK